jgi:Ca2+-binding RTX toxin-like protein
MDHDTKDTAGTQRGSLFAPDTQSEFGFPATPSVANPFRNAIDATVFSAKEPEAAHRLMAITTSRELVLNGDFETGPWAADFAAAVAPAGWGSQGTAVTYAAGIGTPGALTSDPMSDGGLAYYAGGPSTVLSQNSQYLDLTAFASAIDSGTATFVFTADEGGFATQNDHIEIVLNFYDSFGLESSINLVGPDAAARGGVTSLLLQLKSGSIPAGTRAVEIRIVALRADGSYCDAYLDNLSFVVRGEGVSGGAVKVTSNHTFSGDPLGAVTAIQFQAQASVAATFAAEQMATEAPGYLPPTHAGLRVLGDTHADTLTIKIGASHRFDAQNVLLENWSPNDSLIIRGSGGADTIRDGSMNETINAGDGNDSIYMHLGADIVQSGAGDDVVWSFNHSGAISPDDRIDGGAGFDTLRLVGGGYEAGLALQGATLKNFEAVIFGDGYDYRLTMNNANLAAGASFVVNASAILAGHGLTFNGAKETDASFIIYGGQGNDTLTGGGQGDQIFGEGGVDLLKGGAGADSFGYAALSDSYGVLFDTIDGFDSSSDAIDISLMAIAFNGLDARVMSGKLKADTFDLQLAKLAGPAQLHAHDAVLVTPSAGSYVGDTFLVVDVNGQAGYQAGQDLVICLSHAVAIAAFTAGNIHD